MRSQDAVACSHDGLHSIQSRYDRRAGVLVFHWTCDRCGAPLGEFRRKAYRPDFHAGGYERFLTVAAR